MTVTDTKSQILSASIALFALNGYEKTSMRNIAKKVSIKPASIYHFYTSKESILDAILNEFETDFSKHRTPLEEILLAAKTQPLEQALELLFYRFGDSPEKDRMLAISRVILSLKYENNKAQAVYEKVMIQDAMDYGVLVFQNLCAIGAVKETNFNWMTYIFHSFAVALFEDSLRRMIPCPTGYQNYQEGIRFLCSKLAGIIKPTGDASVGSALSSHQDGDQYQEMQPQRSQQ